MRPPEIKYITCDSCGGLGTLPGPRTGRLLKREREERSVTMDQMVPHFGYQKTYIHDLEHDQRGWNHTLVEKYRAAIELAVKARLEASVEAGT